MSRLDDLLDDFYADERFLQKKSMQSKTYRDEPILKRASAMSNYTPPKIAEMRALAARPGYYNWSSPLLFVRQGRLMADYEDDFPFSGTFFRYYPTYQLMSDAQLRGYFSWRTRVRRGQIEPIALSFVFVYVYELLNLIGVDSPEEGYEKLVAFRNAYAPIDGTVEHYLRDWLVDFVAYYGLDAETVRDAESLLPYRQYTVLSRFRQHTDDELFAAVTGLSSYNIENSKFYKAFPEDTRRVLCGVFRAFSEHHEKSCKNSLCERLFGSAHTTPYTMFCGAVFLQDKEQPDRDYEIFPWFGYMLRYGTWYRTRLDRSPAKNRKLGELVRDVDAVMRGRYGFEAPLKQTDKTKLFTGIVNREIDAVLEEKRRKAAAVIHIDVAKLNAIRKDASVTREKLMTEEERGNGSGERNSEFGARNGSSPTAPEIEGQGSLFDPAPQPPEEKPEKKPEGLREKAAEPAGESALPLDDTELRVLRAVLRGEDGEAAARSAGRMLSVVIDAVNEKLFDRFGDAVIYYEGDTPAVYEDYGEELKGMTGA